MRAVVQRCLKGNVTINGVETAKIEKGLVVLIGFKNGEQEKDFDYMIKKILNLRIFEDDNEKLNFSVVDKKLELLIIPNFTIYGDARKGNRPSFTNSCEIGEAKVLFQKIINRLEENYIIDKVKSGVFQEDMKVNLINDGPITVILDSDKII